jgi:hypothetical protein
VSGQVLVSLHNDHIVVFIASYHASHVITLHDSGYTAAQSPRTVNALFSPGSASYQKGNCIDGEYHQPDPPVPPPEVDIEAPVALSERASTLASSMLSFDGTGGSSVILLFDFLLGLFALA